MSQLSQKHGENYWKTLLVMWSATSKVDIFSGVVQSDNMKLSRYLIPMLTFFLGVFLCLSYFFIKDFKDRLSQSSRYIFSGQYSNEEYGFSFANIPEGWMLQQNEVDNEVDEDFIRLSWVTDIPDVNFDVFVSDHELELSDITYLGKSTERYYYYSFLEFETRGRCETTKDIWDAIQYGVIPSFQLTGY